MSDAVDDWASFWDRPHSIYVNARHFDVHYRDIAEGIIAQLPGTRNQRATMSRFLLRL